MTSRCSFPRRKRRETAGNRRFGDTTATTWRLEPCAVDRTLDVNCEALLRWMQAVEGDDREEDQENDWDA